MLKIIALGFVFLLSGCFGEVGQAPRLTQAARLAHADVELAKPPVPRVYAIQGNQLQVIDVPVRDTSGFVDQQRCFVYRDAEFKTTSLSCESRPDVVVSTSN